jgi:hypothetical protein
MARLGTSLRAQTALPALLGAAAGVTFALLGPAYAGLREGAAIAMAVTLALLVGISKTSSA